MGKNSSIIDLGNFKCVSGMLLVSDPCAKLGSKCQGVLSNAIVGDWAAFAIEEDNVIAALFTMHKNAEKLPNISSFASGLSRIAKAPFTVAVDSGQAGIFDKRFYHDSEVFNGKESMFEKDVKRQYALQGEPAEQDLRWYGHCCDITMSAYVGGVIPFGAVVSSGYGDGCYDCYYHMNEREQVDIAILMFAKS